MQCNNTSVVFQHSYSNTSNVNQQNKSDFPYYLFNNAVDISCYVLSNVGKIIDQYIGVHAEENS